MTTITLKVPAKAKNQLSAIIKEMGGEIISVSTDKEAAKKAKLLAEIKQGLREVKEIKEGKAKSYTMANLFEN